MNMAKMGPKMAKMRRKMAKMRRPSTFYVQLSIVIDVVTIDILDHFYAQMSIVTDIVAIGILDHFYAPMSIAQCRIKLMLLRIFEPYVFVSTMKYLCDRDDWNPYCWIYYYCFHYVAAVLRTQCDCQCHEIPL